MHIYIYFKFHIWKPILCDLDRTIGGGGISAGIPPPCFCRKPSSISSSFVRQMFIYRKRVDF